MGKKHQISYYKTRKVMSDNIAFRNAVAAKRAANRAESLDNEALRDKYSNHINIK